ncbi:hypothetical protein LguiA_028328 [Lonicera macranthoides]
MAGRGRGRGRPLPKFGEWESNGPTNAAGFTVIFNKARDERRTNAVAIGMPASAGAPPVKNNDVHANNNSKYAPPPTLVKNNDLHTNNNSKFAPPPSAPIRNDVHTDNKQNNDVHSEKPGGDDDHQPPPKRMWFCCG